MRAVSGVLHVEKISFLNVNTVVIAILVRESVGAIKRNLRAF
jgi:hypothetical protein